MPESLSHGCGGRLAGVGLRMLAIPPVPRGRRVVGLARGSPGSRIAASVSPSRGPLELQWRFLTKAPRSQLRDSSGFSPDSLGALVEES